MTPADTAALRLLAEAATPGPWLFDADTTGSFWVQGADREARGDGAVALAYNSNNDENDARYIATFSPTTTLALLDEVERLRAESEWVSTAERLPEPDVLVMLADRHVDGLIDGVTIGRWIAPTQTTWTRGRWAADGHWYQPERFTHWRAAPKHPRPPAATRGEGAKP